MTPTRGSQVLHGLSLYRENFEIFLYLAMKPRLTKFCKLALSSEPSARGVKYSPGVEFITKGQKYYMGLYTEILEILVLLNIRTIATNFSPVLGVLYFEPIPKYCNDWYEGIFRISKWSDTGSSWPSCYKFLSPGF